MLKLAFWVVMFFSIVSLGTKNFWYFWTILIIPATIITHRNIKGKTRDYTRKKRENNNDKAKNK